jgi:1-acyl-sn-glycerol-3-phosphate acyltransferase
LISFAENSSGLLYAFLHWIMRYWMRIHFRRVFVDGLTHVPRKGPALLACNHPNSFLDAIVVALILKRRIHFLVRSDVFRKPAARFILSRLNMIPIYRLQEGTENLDKNQETFARCYDLLRKGELILIFSEGNCVVEKRLRALKKGTARIYFGATDWVQNLSVIPVGLNYTAPYQFRSELMVSFGKTIETHDLQPVWKVEPAKAVRVFNDRLSEAMRNELLIIPKKDWDFGAEVLLNIHRLPYRFSFFAARFNLGKRLRDEQEFIAGVFSADADLSQIEHAELLEKAWQKIGIPLGFHPRRVPNWNTAFLCAWFIPAIICALIHLPVLPLVNKAVDKTRKARQFKASVMFGSGALLSYFAFLIVSILFAALMTPWLLLMLPLWPRITWITLLWWEQLQLRRYSIQYSAAAAKHPELWPKLEARLRSLGGV